MSLKNVTWTARALCLRESARDVRVFLRRLRVSAAQISVQDGAVPVQPIGGECL
jgi:hypothetical protein